MDKILAQARALRGLGFFPQDHHYEGVVGTLCAFNYAASWRTAVHEQFIY